jgi:uncharacterized protein YbjT (DUF2867 family)
MIVVTGATGNVGRPLTAALRAAGHTVTAVARGRSAGLPGGPEVIPVTADLTAPGAAGALTPALAGAEALFLLVPGSGAAVDAPALLDAAAGAGLRRVVLLSSQGVGSRPGAAGFAPMAAIESAVTGSGLDWTILRSGGLAANALNWAPAVRAEGAVLAPYGDVALPAVDPLDLADAAAAALTGGEHAGRTYVLTGPEATTPRERTRLIGAAIGRELAFRELSPADARRQLLGFAPAPVADVTLAILGQPTEEEATPGPDTEKVLGRPGRPFAEWARRNAAAFR